MTYHELYSEACMDLMASGCPEPRSDARELLFFVTGFDLSSYASRMNEQVPDDIKEKFYRMLARRKAREPVQYITGTAPFFGYSFLVSPKVLIPRFDTENLVQEAISFLRPDSRILDLCTGSGCILLTLLAEAGEMWGAASSVFGCGSDVSEEALSVARANAARLQLDADFILSDLFDNITGTYDIITSNPPYIPTPDIRELDPEVQKYEPFSALDGKDDGLFFYRRIAEEAGIFLKDGGRLILEIGHDQADAVMKMLAGHHYEEIRCVKDLSGYDRVISACRKEDADGNNKDTSLQYVGCTE